ncbi:hypothetical protein [Herpetosiphon geysericola]|uniref:hypothetical protein n=1 Tax=Herpetosiphon geysericola TaxID=70996 RepID=UPI0006C8F022|nr:hypothetical protein [Herpetosiphon geysericola]
MSRPDYSPTPVVMAINEIAFHGNIIPLTWFHHIQYENGKPNLVAIIILSDVIYWYRPQEQRDEETGKFVGWRSKFKGDMLQRSYDQLSDRLGITKRQAKEATDYLVSEKLLKREFRNVLTDRGNLLPNRMFLEPIPEGIKRINEMPTGGSEVSPTLVEDTMVRQSGRYHGTPEWNTCTEITNSTETSLSTEITNNEINHSSMHESVDSENSEPKHATDMHGVDVLSKNPSYRLLKECGVRSDKVLAELSIIPVEIIQAEWALVKNSTMPAHYKPNQLAKNLRSWLVDQAANPEPAPIVASDPKPEHPSIARADWQDLGRYDRSQALSQYMDDLKAWTKRNEGR